MSDIKKIDNKLIRQKLSNFGDLQRNDIFGLFNSRINAYSLLIGDAVSFLRAKENFLKSTLGLMWSKSRFIFFQHKIKLKQERSGRVDEQFAYSLFGLDISDLDDHFKELDIRVVNPKKKDPIERKCCLFCQDVFLSLIFWLVGKRRKLVAVVPFGKKDIRTEEATRLDPLNIKNYLVGDSKKRSLLYIAKKKRKKKKKAPKKKKAKKPDPPEEADESDDEMDLDDQNNFERSEHPSTMCIFFGSNTSPYKVGAAVLTSHTNKLEVTHFEDNGQLSDIESVIIQKNVQSCIHRDIKKRVNKAAYDRLQDVFSRTNVNARVIDKSIEGVNKFKNILQVSTEKVGTLLSKRKTAPKVRMDSFHPLSLVALCYLIDDSSLLANPTKNQGNFTLSGFNLRDRMRFDSCFANALRILPSPFRHDDRRMTAQGERESSLYGVLNRCKTKMGAMRLNEWLRSPLCDKRQIKTRLNIVEELTENEDLRVTLGNTMKKLPDTDRLVKKLMSRKKRNIHDMHALKTTIIEIGLIKFRIGEIEEEDERSHVKERFLTPLTEKYNSLSLLLTMLEECINWDQYDYYITMEKGKVPIEEVHFFKDDFEPAETKSYEKLYDYDRELDEELQRVINYFDLDSRFRRGYSFTFKKTAYGKAFYIKAINEHAFNSVFGKMQKRDTENILKVIAQSPTTLVFYTEKIRYLSMKVEKYHWKIYTFEEEVMKWKVWAVCSTYVSEINEAIEWICALDILCSFAEVSLNNNYCKPDIFSKENGLIEIEKGRHPIVERQYELRMENRRQYIPNDMTMTSDGTKFMCITGPNMGGKSCYILTTALIAIMAQVGCFVPAEKCSMSVLDGVFCRIGGNDYLSRGISTFFNEMQEIESRFVSYELVTVQRNALSQNNTPSTSTGSQSEGAVEEKRIALNYKVESGIGEDSFGINVAVAAKFPDVVVRKSKRKLRELSDENLEEETEEGEKKRRKIDKTLVDVSRKTNEIVAKGLRKFFNMSLDKALSDEDEKPPIGFESNMKSLAKLFKDFEEKEPEAFNFFKRSAKKE